MEEANGQFGWSMSLGWLVIYVCDRAVALTQDYLVRSDMPA